MTSYHEEQEIKDRELTLKNRSRLFKNRNLLFWYEKLFECQFSGIVELERKKILEIGSGTSPLKLFYQHVITSDVLQLDYLDMFFDCHDIDRYENIEHGSFDVIVLTNVLHHLRDPVLFMLKASKILKPGGSIILAEPYFSTLSKFIYEKIHHEFSSLEITEPRLKEISGPLSSANQALSYLIFFGNRNWSRPLQSAYDFDVSTACYYSSLSYMMTGGISRKIPIPSALYRFLFKWDMKLAQAFPDLLCSFFVLRLKKR